MPPAHPRSGLAEPFAGPISLRDALACFADVTSSPHKENLAALAAAATDDAQRARLLHLASAAGKADYQEYITKQHRSLLEVRSLGLLLGCMCVWGPWQEGAVGCCRQV